MNSKDSQRNDLIQVARIYYEQELSQQEIADRLGVSRSLISLYLRKARERGIIRIEIADRGETYNRELASQIQERIKVANVCVVPSSQTSEALARRSLSAVVARYLEDNLSDGDIIGFGWGRAIMEIAGLLAPRKARSIEVVPLMGESASTISASYSQINQVVQQIAQVFGGTPNYLLAPLVVGSEKLCNEMYEDEAVRRVASFWGRLNYACIGVGVIPPSPGQIVYLGEENLAFIQQAGAIGDIVARYFDFHGNYVESPVHGRLIGVDIEQLRKTDHVIALASEIEKAKAVIGIVRAKLITDLFISQTLAEAILDELQG
jgi:deoxyribonucleoside regulator